MNFDILMEVSGLTFDASTLMKVAGESNDLASCLTAHLAIERFLEAWICAHTGIEDLFQKNSNDKTKVHFGMNFMNKAKLAQRMGLPKLAYEAIDQLNFIRNNFAHRHNYQGATNDEMKRIIAIVDKMNQYGLTKLGDPQYKLMLNFEGREATYHLNSPDCPHRVKYMAITYGVLIRCLHFAVNELKLSFKYKRDYRQVETYVINGVCDYSYKHN